MYNGFDSTIGKILGGNRLLSGRPKRDRYRKDMSQEAWEEANKKAREKGFSTNPASKRRLIVSPYHRVTQKHPEAVSEAGKKTMAMRVELHEFMPEADKTGLQKELERLADKKLNKSYLFKNVEKPYGKKRQVDEGDIFENL